MIRKRYKPRATNHGPQTKLGSALILAVVLTSLLAIIGVMFIMIARVDKMATSAISENKELNFAVEAVVALVSQELVLDVPGVAAAEYYDYPGDWDKWLANLEPYKKPAGNYYWRQISDVYNKFGSNVELQAEIIQDYQEPSDVGDSNSTKDYPADADGDGVADSKWVELADITSNKGKPIYAAVRVVDNGAMLNVNTAYKFDPNDLLERINGSSQTQIDLLALSERGSTSDPLGKLDDARFGSEPHNLDDYIRDVVWRYNEPNGLYTPFDISDELEIRNRFTLNRTDVNSRLENLWADVFKGTGYLSTPVVTAGDYSDWLKEVHYDLSEPNAYSYRHIGTIYNMDRIIRPNGAEMLNVNDPAVNVSSLYSAIRAGLYDADSNFVDANGAAAQIAVNLTDFRDNDSNVSTIDVNGIKYYGFERPCVYTSELAYIFKTELAPGGTGPSPFPYITYRSYAIELYKPYPEDSYPEPNQWRLNIQGYGTVDVNWSGSEHFHVIYFEDSCCTPLPINFDIDANFPSPYALKIPINPYITVFTSGGTISLQRKINGTDWISVDSIDVPPWLVSVPPGQVNPETTRSYKRDITQHKCIRRLWSPEANKGEDPSLGQRDAYYHDSSATMIQAHPANSNFTNIGEIGMLFRKPAYYDTSLPAPPPGVIGYGSGSSTEEEVRLNLADPNFQQLFKYLTVFDPAVYPWNDPNETRIKGRININTAPWFVLAQLPWVSQRKSYDNTALAQAIVAYRDKLDLSSTGGPDYYHGGAFTSRETETGINGLRNEPGFNSIGELATVINTNSGQNDYSMNYYSLDNIDLAGFPDLTTPNQTSGDGAKDDFEERDVIFARISNLVTVRSDVFTAYILVRIGPDGPQKRVMAILDRSNVRSPADKVRVIALYPVPDPR
jgi:hypothetical protein